MRGYVWEREDGRFGRGFATRLTGAPSSRRPPSAPASRPRRGSPRRSPNTTRAVLRFAKPRILPRRVAEGRRGALRLPQDAPEARVGGELPHLPGAREDEARRPGAARRPRSLRLHDQGGVRPRNPARGPRHAEDGPETGREM